jgi:hypothetical protein
MAITRTQIARQLQNRGGITNMSVRQHYGLGSIVKKAVKGVSKAAKNIVSSDLGKAALLAGGAYLTLGGGMPQFLGGRGLGFGGVGPKLPAFLGGDKEIFKTAIDKFPGGGKGIAGAIGLTGFLASQGLEEEQIEEIKSDPESLKVYLRRYYTNLNPPTADTDADTYNKEVEDFVTSQTAEYSTSFATGGRVGFNMGGLNLDSKAKKHLRMVFKQKGANPDGLSFNEWVPLNFEWALGFKEGGRVNRRLGSPEEGEGIMMIEQTEEMAGGPYTTGNDVKDAFGVWNNSDQGVKELYEGFIDFFKSGDWRDQIQGSKIKTKTKRMASAPDPLAELNNLSISVFNKPYNSLNEMEMEQLTEFMSNKKAEGGPINNIARMDFKVGEGVASLPLRQNKAGVKELDLRSAGGFIPPIGTKEKADDVPAMLSNNEFVFTADAVRAAGGGNVEKGAQRMYDTMKKLESRIG